MAEESPPFTILLVCTGNVCRSALAERLGSAFLAERLGERAASVRLASAGTRAVVGSGMHPDTALVLQGLGGEPGAFRARQLDARMALDADLVLTMTRSHRREVLRVSPRALQRTFTLREAADLLDLLRSDARPGADDGTERARGLVAELAAARSRRPDAAGRGDDVEDPIGRSVEVQQATGEAIAAALLPILDRIAALVREDGGQGAARRTP